MVRELLAVLVRAALQWALASLLLANGAAFCLIAAAASSLRLGPPCLLCARVHRLLCSSSSRDADCSQEGEDAFRRLLCGAHLAAIARLGSAETEQQACSPSHRVDTGTKYDSDKPAGLESHRVVSIGSQICEQDRGGDDDQPRATNLSILRRTSSVDSEGPYVSLFELAPLVALPEDNPPDYDAKEPPHGHGTTKPEHESASSSDAAGGEQLTVSGLVDALRAQRRELEAARAELQGERRARAELEEQGELDREAARVAMQLVHETETEKHELQRQLDAFRVRAQLHDYEAAASDADCSAAPANRLGRRLSRDGGGELMVVEDEGGWSGNKNYQSLVDFLPGSVYSSSPDLANLLRLYTEGNGNGARRPKEGDIVTEEEEEEEEEVVVAIAAAAVSGFDGGDGEATSVATAAGASLPESGSDHVQADLAQDEAAVMSA